MPSCFVFSSTSTSTSKMVLHYLSSRFTKLETFCPSSLLKSSFLTHLRLKNQFISFNLRTPLIFVTTKIHQSSSNFYFNLQLGFLHPFITLLHFSNLIFQKPTFGSKIFSLFVPVLLTVLSTNIKTVN